MFLVVGSRFVVSLSRNVALDDGVVGVDDVDVGLVCGGGLIDLGVVLVLLETDDDNGAAVAAAEEEEGAVTVRDGDALSDDDAAGCCCCCS